MRQQFTLEGRVVILLLAVVTLLVFGIGGAALITWVQDRDLAELMVRNMGMPMQLLIGGAFGTVVALGAKKMLRHRSYDHVRERYGQLIRSFRSTRLDRVMISISAGIGEEIFFRGAIQHWLGILLTAIIFVAMHGYLDPRDRQISLYGGALVIVMIAFGYMAEHWGLYAPMAAHAAFDMVLLEMLHHTTTPELIETRSEEMEGE